MFEGNFLRIGYGRQIDFFIPFYQLDAMEGKLTGVLALNFNTQRNGTIDDEIFPIWGSDFHIRAN